MREVLAEHRPTIVFHAGGLQARRPDGGHPVEAVRNNAIATRVVAHVAGELGVRRFVLVSRTGGRARDRDGRVQGACRVRARGGDCPLQGHALRRGRFGNVLGSSGSVGADLPPPDRSGAAR